MRPSGCIMIMACIVVLSTTAAAQQKTMSGPADSEHREETRRKIEAVRLSRLTERLQLDERTAAKFIPAITAIEQKRRAQMAEHREAMTELRRLLDAQPLDAGKLRATIDKLTVSQRETFKLREKEWETARDHLTVEQQARYIVFQQEFMQEVRDIIGVGRGEGRGMGGPGMGPRPVGPRRSEPVPGAPAER